MNVTQVRLQKSTNNALVKAFGKAVIDNELSLDVIVMDKGNGQGAWVTFPGGKKSEKDGKYYTPVFFVNENMRNSFNTRVIEEYNKLDAPRSNSNANIPAEQSNQLPF